VRRLAMAAAQVSREHFRVEQLTLSSVWTTQFPFALTQLSWEIMKISLICWAGDDDGSKEKLFLDSMTLLVSCVS